MDKEKLNKVIGKNIREYRKKRDLSLYDISEYVDLSYRTIEFIERGAKGMRIDKLIKFADILSVRVDDLIKGWEHC